MSSSRSRGISQSSSRLVPSINASAAISGTVSPFADTAEPHSLSDVSVRSECDQVNFQNTSFESTLTTAKGSPIQGNTYRNIHLEKKRTDVPLYDLKHPDFVEIYEEIAYHIPKVPGSSLKWESTSDVCDVMIHGRQPSFEKHSERVVPNPWRRHGTLVKLAAVGGWSNKRREGLVTEIKRGSTPPRQPNVPQMALHRDTKHPMDFDFPPKNVPSDVCAQQLALQVASRAIDSWSKEKWYNPKRPHYLNPTLRLSNIHKLSEATIQAHSKKSLRESDYSTAVSGRFSSSSSAASAALSSSTCSTFSATRSGRLSALPPSTVRPKNYQTLLSKTPMHPRLRQKSEESTCSTANSQPFSPSSFAASPTDYGQQSEECLTAVSGQFTAPPSFSPMRLRSSQLSEKSNCSTAVSGQFSSSSVSTSQRPRTRRNKNRKRK